ncbi:hypothetical protein [Yoonia algicola]|uniref:Uncharacterized protein n=1 Tax=Yoonia algicola TaxID=3137368 RepID=A0AAN0M4N3_9RHOB
MPAAVQPALKGQTHRLGPLSFDHEALGFKVTTHYLFSFVLKLALKPPLSYLSHPPRISIKNTQGVP